MQEKEYLLGKTLSELKLVAEKMGMPRFAAKQMADWLYKKRVTEIDAMTNIAQAKRAELAEHYEVGRTAPTDAQRSVDGTVKYLFAVGNAGRTVETVYLPTDTRATLCVSSQVGCKMNCQFCMTGRQGFNGQLTSRDILNQILSVPESETLTNIVFMGMGEPMDNIDEVLKTLEVLTSDYGYAWSPKRITVSTVGVRRGLERFLRESDCHLAVSLHSPFPEERVALMPAERALSTEELFALLNTEDFSHQRRLSFEYTCFRGHNDTPAHAEALAKLLKGIPCRVNLIRFHAIPDSELETSDLQRMEHFQEILNKRGVICTIRASRGEDIFAACGMLSTAKNKN